MEDKLCYAEEDAELERDWKTCLDFDDTPHHEPILSTSKRNERAITERAPPTPSAQAVRLVQHSGSERQQPGSMTNTKHSQNPSLPDEKNRDWQFVEDHSLNEILLCKICLDVLMSPHLITCCGQCVCKKCIDRHMQRQAVIQKDNKPCCPFCRNLNLSSSKTWTSRNRLESSKCIVSTARVVVCGQASYKMAKLISENVYFVPLTAQTSVNMTELSAVIYPSTWLNARCKSCGVHLNLSVAKRSTHFSEKISRPTPTGIFITILFCWLGPI